MTELAGPANRQYSSREGCSHPGRFALQVVTNSGNWMSSGPPDYGLSGCLTSVGSATPRAKWCRS